MYYLLYIFIYIIYIYIYIYIHITNYKEGVYNKPKMYLNNIHSFISFLEFVILTKIYYKIKCKILQIFILQI